MNRSKLKLLEFYTENEEWLRDIVKSPERPAVLRAMAAVVLAEAEDKEEQNQDGPKNEKVSF